MLICRSFNCFETSFYNLFQVCCHICIWISLLRGRFGCVRYLFTATKQVKTEKVKPLAFAFLLNWWEQQGYKKKVTYVERGSHSRCRLDASVFQHVNFFKFSFFCRKTCILQYPHMVSKAWQKTFKWSGLSRRMHLINFDKFNLLFPIQAQVSSTLFGGGICSSSPCNLLRANMNNTQLGYQGPYYLEWCIKHQHCTVKISSTLVRIEKANCIFVWDPANLLPAESVLIASR